MLRWFANLRRPDATDETSMSWRLLSLRGRRVDLVLLMYSDDPSDYRPAEHNQLWVALSGHFVLNNTFISAPDIVFVRADRPCNVRLDYAQSYEEQLLDLAWMDQPDIHYNTERRAWLLAIS